MLTHSNHSLGANLCRATKHVIQNNRCRAKQCCQKDDSRECCVFCLGLSAIVAEALACRGQNLSYFYLPSPFVHLNIFMFLQNVVNKLYDYSLEIQPLTDRVSDTNGDLYNHYHCQERQSTNLLVTIGDSWTKGQGLGANQYSVCYGAQLSALTNSDWLNCAGSGYSNSWMLSQLEFLLPILNQSSYLSGAVVLTFTENGRDFRDYCARKFDYISNYKAFSKTQEFYEIAMNDVEKEWCDRLANIVQKLDPRFQLVVGNNFCHHTMLEDFCKQNSSISFIEPRWIDLLAEDAKVEPPVRYRVMSTLGILTLNEILGIVDCVGYKTWFVDYSDKKQRMVKWLDRTSKFFEPHDISHPNAQGHTIWANAVKEVLTFDLGVANPSVRPAAGHAP